jgi:uncharacterized protein
MTEAHPAATVRDDRERQRFVIVQDGAEAYLTYTTEPGRLILVHTEVPDALSGHGFGGDLVSAAVQRAHADGLTLVPWCPFARRLLRRHPEVAGGVPVDWKTPAPHQAAG